MSERITEDTRRPYNYEVAENWKEWVGRPWPESHKDRGLGGCYQIVRDFYKTYYGRDLYDYPSQKKYLFKSEYIEEEQRRQGGFYDRLQGGYSWKEGRTCNHCGIYLGDGFMLHHPAWETSRIADLVALQYWADNTEVVLRLKDRKLLKPYIKTKGEVL